MNCTTTTVPTNFTAYLLVCDLQIPMFVLILLGFPTHSYVIWLILTGTANSFATDFFNLNNSFCEIGTCVDFFIFLLTSCLPSLFPVAMFLQGFSITGRPLFQCLMCVERYLAVVHPVTFLKYKPLRYRVICSVVAWIITLGSCLGNMFIFSFSSVVVHSWFLSVQFVLFLSIQLFCLVAVLRALKQSGPGERKREKEENHMKRRAFYLILITTVSMAFTYLPSTISGVYTFLTQQFNLVLWGFSVLTFVLAGFVQPVLFLHRAGKLSCICSP